MRRTSRSSRRSTSPRTRSSVLRRPAARPNCRAARPSGVIIAVIMELITDVRLALRRLRSAPAFSAGVIGTLALGLAAATSMYTVVDGVLLKPLPFPESQRLVRVGADFTGRELRDVGISQPELDDFAKKSGALE